MEAATNGSYEVVELLLKAGADPLLRDIDGFTPIMTAAHSGDVPTCEALIARDARVNEVADSGSTALMFAAAKGNVDVVQILLKEGANVNTVVHATPEYIERSKHALEAEENDVDEHTEGVTSLMLAAGGGHEEVVDLLLAAGANVTCKDADGSSPLMYAVNASHFGVATKLIRAGSDLNDSTVAQEAAELANNLLHDALVAGNEELSLALLERGAIASYVGKGGIHCLTAACINGLIKAVDMLIKMDACHIDGTTDLGATALMAAASEGHAKIVATLLNAGASSIIGDVDGTTALMAAAANSHLDALEALLKASPSALNAKNNEGHTALMFAVNTYHQMAQFMDRYASLLVDSNDTLRLLDEALATSQAVEKALRNAGADTTIQNNEGQTAADLAYKGEKISSNDFQAEEL